MADSEAGASSGPREELDPNASIGCPSGSSPASISVLILAADQGPSPKPGWFTPVRLLIVFCVINLLNYVDRGAIASNGVNGSIRTCNESGICTSGTGIQGDFHLNNFQDGVLASAFMVGLLVASPIFASFAKSHNPFRLIGVGLSVWTFATTGCGFSFDFWSITICRMLVGVGEASFISLAAPFIDDNAPPAQKTAWLGVFYMCIPSGIALGYVYGGLVGSNLSWRAAFWGEAMLMFPFAVLGFWLKPIQLKGFTHSQTNDASKSVESMVSKEKEEETSTDKADMLSGAELISKTPSLSKAPKFLSLWSSFWKDLKFLLADKVFGVNVLGYVVYTFVIGAYSYWGPKAGHDIYGMTNADMIFGGLTIVCGIIGTLAGGYILDFLHSTICNAFKLLSVTTFLGAVFCFAAFCSKNLYVFISLFAVGELLLFAAQAPVNYVCLHCVKPGFRALSMAVSTVSIHIFGDVPSSPLVGVVQDHLQNWRKTALILTSIFFLAAVTWFGGIFLRSVDRFNEDSETDVVSVERSNGPPLFDAKTTALESL